MPSRIRKANNFVVAEGSEGELYIYIEALSSRPEKPRIIYDGRDHAIFLRSPEERVILDYIHPEVREKLRQADGVIMVETLLENIKDSYVAEMQIVDTIPIDWSKVELKSWEEAMLEAK